MSVQPTFSGEVQMRRWSDSSTQGVQITFALPDAEALEPLKHKTGKRFACVLVEIGDDEMPVQPEPPKKSRKDTRGPVCREACDYCVNAEFQNWASEHSYERNEAGAKAFILHECGISSRTELDADPLAGEAFRERLRIPFIRWQRAQRK